MKSQNLLCFQVISVITSIKTCYHLYSKHVSDKKYILNKKHEVLPKLEYFESATCKQCKYISLSRKKIT